MSVVLSFALNPVSAQTSTNAGEVSPTSNAADTATESQVDAVIEEIVAEVAGELGVDLTELSSSLNELSEKLFARNLVPSSTLIAAKTRAAIDGIIAGLSSTEKADPEVEFIVEEKLMAGNSISTIVSTALQEGVDVADIIKGLLVGGLPARSVIGALLEAGVPEEDIVSAVSSVVAEGKSQN